HLEGFLAADAGTASVRAKAFVRLGNLLARANSPKAAREAYERGRDLSVRAGDDRSLSWAEGGLAALAMHFDADKERGKAHVQASFEAALRSGDKGYVSDALRHAGVAAIDAGEYARARASLEEALGLAEQVGDEMRAGRAA